MTINEALREHTTSVAFQLILSRNMIDMLVLCHHFKGSYNAIRDAGFTHHPATWNWTVTQRALKDRGLLPQCTVLDKAQAKAGYRVIDNIIIKPTKAGTLVVNLLKEAGLYQERLTELLGSIEKGYYRHRGTDHILRGGALIREDSAS